MFYNTSKNEFGLRIASSYVLRELYKNKIDYVDKFLKDLNSVESLKDLLQSSNTYHIQHSCNFRTFHIILSYPN